MTRDQIVTEVAQRLNLTSPAALARIADDVNERYNWLLGTVGLATSSRGVVTANSVIGYRYVTFYNAQKLLSVFNAQGITLIEVSFDELRNAVLSSDPPQKYAVSTMGPTFVTIFLDCVPASIYTLSADALVDAATLGATDVPAFPQVYHDILVYGAKAVELRKMGMESLADEAEAMFERRLSELRYFIAMSAYREIYQGKTSNDALVTRLMV